MEIAAQSLTKANTIELHYWFNEETHTMNAFTQNQCEFEFLCMAKELSKIFGVQIIIETEPLENGGLRRWFKILAKNEGKSATVVTALLISFLTTLVVTPFASVISTVSTKVVEEFFKDPEIEVLEKEKLKKELESLKLEIELKRQKIDNNKILERRKSNFYEQLIKYPKVSKISIQKLDQDHNPLTPPYFVEREKFVEFVMISDEYEPEIHENAIIELISPVLKKGDYKWRGYFRGEPVSFSMKSTEFKTMVQTGQVEFKNGTSIDCFLEIKRKIDGEGNIQNVEFNIIRVNRYFDNDNPIETQEGKFHRQKKEGDNAQLKIFPQDPDGSKI